MGMATIFKKTLYLMELLARENSAVQETLFEHIDDLLEVQIVPSNLAIALKEVNNKIPFYFDIKKPKKFKKSYHYSRICIVLPFFSYSSSSQIKRHV